MQNPVIAFDVSCPEPGKLHVGGYAFNRNDFSATVRVDVYTGDEGIGSTYANAYRPDVNDVYGCGDYHGIDATFDTSKTGTIVVRVAALSNGLTSWSDELAVDITPAATQPPAATGDNPVVAFDVSCPEPGKLHVGGYAFNKNDFNATVRVDVYSGDDGIGSTYANAYRPDVNNVYGCGDYHGIDATFNTSKTGVIKVRVAALSNGLTSWSDELEVEIKPAPSGKDPVICLDSVSSPSEGKIHIHGWAYDPDDTGKTLAIHAYSGSTFIGGYAANAYRPDVNNVHGCGDYHGFDVTFNTTLTGTFDVKVAALNVGGGENKWSDAKSVTVAADKTKPTLDNIVVTDISTSSYTLMASASDNVQVKAVKFPTWNQNQEGSAATWYEGQKSGNVWSCTVSRPSTEGTYYTDTYVYDLAGNECSSTVRAAVKNITVSFDANGGKESTVSKLMPVLVSGAGNKPNYGTLPTVTRTGYVLDGWYTSPTGGTEVTADTIISNALNHTLYAHWSRVLSLTAQPKDYIGSVSSTASFSVSAVGDGLTYQWQFSDNNGKTWKNSSATTADYKTKLTSARDGRLVRCIVSDKYGNSVTSDAASMTIYKFAITTQPVDYVGKVNSYATFSVAAQGDGVTYQWQFSDNGGKKWTNSSVKTAEYSTKLTSARNGRLVRCVVTDQNGSTVTSSVVSMKLYKLAITQQPVDYVGKVNSTASFTVAAQGDGLTYQWQLSTNGGKKWTNSSVTDPVYASKLTSARDGRMLRCIVTDVYGTKVTSDVVSMNIG